MLSNRILKQTIAGGHEVPWSEPLTDQGYFFPKDYRMNAYPRTPEGDIWYDIPDDDYFSWLADYLGGGFIWAWYYEGLKTKHFGSKSLRTFTTIGARWPQSNLCTVCRFMGGSSGT